jgi:hypothetical protein
MIHRVVHTWNSFYLIGFDTILIKTIPRMHYAVDHGATLLTPYVLCTNYILIRTIDHTSLDSAAWQD